MRGTYALHLSVQVVRAQTVAAPHQLSAARAQGRYLDDRHAPDVLQSHPLISISVEAPKLIPNPFTILNVQQPHRGLVYLINVSNRRNSVRVREF